MVWQEVKGKMKMKKKKKNPRESQSHSRADLSVNSDPIYLRKYENQYVVFLLGAAAESSQK